MGKQIVSPLHAMSLDSLFDEAAKYGRVSVFSSEYDQHPNCYRVTITFNTRQGTEMKAKSEFGMTVKNGLVQAIDNAHDMVKLAREIGA